MTELERIKHARDYVDKLAHGINPMTGLHVSEHDVVNEIHISKCLLFVTGLLDKLIDESGSAQQRRSQRLPFTITEEQKNRFEYSPVPITVSEIARRLNVAAEVGTGSPQLRYSSIIFWLIEVELLTIYKYQDGREIKEPTATGSALGISMEERAGDNGVYNVIVYNEAAQRHIVNNIEAIIDTEKLRFKMQGQPWSREDDARLEELASKGVPVYEIALELKRNISSVRSRLKKLELMSTKTGSVRS